MLESFGVECAATATTEITTWPVTNRSPTRGVIGSLSPRIFATWSASLDGSLVGETHTRSTLRPLRAPTKPET